MTAKEMLEEEKYQFFAECFNRALTCACKEFVEDGGKLSDLDWFNNN